MPDLVAPPPRDGGTRADADRAGGGVATESRLGRELSGLDNLDLAPARPRRSLGRRAWDATWPKLLATFIGLFAWQVVVWSGWKPEFVLPGPVAVFQAFVEDFGDIAQATATTLRRGAVGFSLAVLIGTVIGALVARSKILRSAVGSLITGLQTMPSIAWFPLAIVLFQLSESAILFVVVLGAAPSVANGLLNGFDHIPPILLRQGHVLGAHGFREVWHIVLPAALPAFVGGLKQGWAFAWRSLLAGELIVFFPGVLSLGQRLQIESQFADYPGMIAVMMTILVIGIVIDIAGFGTVEKAIRRRYGLIDAAAE